MKGQSEIIIYILLFVIGVSLFLSAVIWSRGIVDKNSDMAKLNYAESFMKNLDSKIQNIVKFGGQDSINYGLDATIGLIGADTIEISSPFSIEIPREWITLQSGSSIIKEKLDGNLLRLQLFYPQSEYAIYLFTDGATSATPQKVFIEKDTSFVQSGITYNRVKITFK